MDWEDYRNQGDFRVNTCYFDITFQILRIPYIIPVFDCTLRAKNLVRELTATCKCEREKFAAIWAPSCGIV